MIDFYLHKYTTKESITNGLVAPHKYRHPITKKMGLQQECLNGWNKDKNKILKEFIIKMKTIFIENDSFLLFTPPTNTKIFLDFMIKGIKQSFPNVIDFTYCFEKTCDVSFGEEKYNLFTLDQLLLFVKIDAVKISKADKRVKNAFIIDDVFATGKSLILTKQLIQANFRTDMIIKSGVILDTSK